jgi:hypothetical protein
MGLDSAEMTLQGYLLGVMHPPGYPLLTVYNATVIRLFSFVSPIMAVGIGNCLLGAATIGLLARFVQKRNGAWSLTPVLALSVCPLFWNYATTPEVFIGLQLFAVGFACLLYSPELYRRTGFIFFLALSVLHHQTIIFLSPWLLRASWANRCERRAHLWAVAAGLICLAGYASLLWLNPDGLFSWSWLLDIQDVVAHFLRKEYGTFSLTTNNSAATLSSRFQLLGESVFLYAWLPISFLVMAGRSETQVVWRSSTKILLATVAMYFILFTGLAAITLTIFGKEVLQRFFLMPIVLLHAAAAMVWVPRSEIEKKITASLVTFHVVLSLIQVIGHVTSGKREIQARYYRDMLERFPPNAVVNLKGDSAFFITGYYQQVEGIRRDLALIPFRLHPSRHIKLQRHYPDLFNSNFEGHSILSKLSPDAQYFEVGASTDLRVDLDIVRHELSFHVKPGTGKMRFRCDPTGPIYAGPAEPLREVDSSGYVSLNYGMCDFLKGLYLIRDNKLEDAQRSFQAAVRKNPWLVFAQERLCHVMKLHQESTSECLAQLDRLLTVSAQEYLDQKFYIPPSEVRVDWETL